MKKLKIAMLGFGNAGQAFAKLFLDKKNELKNDFELDLIFVAITTKGKGSLLCDTGIDLEKALRDVAENGVFDPSSPNYSDISSIKVSENVNFDLLIELTPLEIMSGEPAISHITNALTRGKHVITANKGPIAWAYNELKLLAEKKSCNFFFETTVMDGTPVFNLTEKTLKYCKVTGVSGILNTTTNFILEELSAGKEYSEILKEGKIRGFVEADPAMDVEGYDAAAKLTALLNVLMDAKIKPTEVYRKGITEITYEDLVEAKKEGATIKLFCEGGRDDAGNIVASVYPKKISADSIYATISGTSSVVSITTDLMGTISVIEHEPEIEQTAYGIFSDLIRVLDNINKIEK